ncbi:phage holin family protein [Cellulomonas rhizosphaerae]|uniref:Phage holin family protein n=1 Tax=Cellulomonas rhizosphaerae TaxID=2293719 RepID=A0A413RR88_9CELL|nr:phage holin family protein [Cellulomonas rhizosphaerae]RHA44440.1 phage holin family protein [Cellulomonas rhizosphaerae]
MSDGAHTDAPPRASVGDLLGEVTRDLSTLLRQEVELAKAEAKQSAQQAAKGGSMFAGAALAGHMVLLFASIALWWALGNAMGRSWAALVCTVVWAVIGAVLFVRGKAEARRVKGLPRTAESVKKIPNALQGHEEKN